MPLGMKGQRRHLVLLASLALSGGLLLLLLVRRPAAVAPPAVEAALVPEKISAETTPLVPEEPSPDGLVAEAQARVAAALLENLQRLLSRRDARPQEGLLTFKDDDAYRRFLSRAT